MPTFDFINFIRKIVSTALSAAFSPIAIVISASALIATCFESLVQFFNDDFTLPSLSLGQFSSDGNSDVLNLLLYAVNFDAAVEIVNSTLGFVSSLITWSVTFFSSVLAIVVLVGCYKVVRRQIMDSLG